MSQLSLSLPLLLILHELNNSHDIVILALIPTYKHK